MGEAGSFLKGIGFLSALAACAGTRHGAIRLQLKTGRSSPALPVACPCSARIASMGRKISDVYSGGSICEPLWVQSLSSVTVPSLHSVPRPLEMIGGNARLFLCAFSYQDFASSNSDNDGKEEDIWQRVELLERLLGLAISEENYSEAKRICDQLVELKAQLTEAEQLVLERVGSLRNGSIGERIEAIAALGDIGDKCVLPVLMDGLHDNNPLITAETERAMWKIFMHSGRDDVDRRLHEGVTLMLSKDFTSARDTFTEVIEMAPSFAEGWNKRGTTNYLLQDYRASIEDCKQTLELNPYHFGALSGMGLCHIAIEDLESALFWFEKAYAIHPGLGQINKYIEVLKQKLAKPEKDVEKKNDEDHA